jgi:hydroxymethylglutaryl-CoA lyase
MNFPNSVTLIEVGLRDGFQFESKVAPTELKLDIISELVQAGLKHLQVASFVNPKLVPQMADAEELLKRLPKHDGVIYSGLVLNTKGVERAFRAGLEHVGVSISVSDTHSRKNSGMSLDKAISEGKEMIRRSKECGMHVTAGVQCAFGCVYEGSIPEDRVLAILSEFMSLGIDRISIADTTGMADPLSIKSLVRKLIPELNGVSLSLHLHDTRGLGLVNVMAAMECGIKEFDCSLAGMGGCPFVAGAAGNIATEDTAYLMKTLNIETGVDIQKLGQCSMRLEKFFEKRFPGKVCRLNIR